VPADVQPRLSAGNDAPLRSRCLLLRAVASAFQALTGPPGLRPSPSVRTRPAPN
jgi:hypothetical protein